MKRHTARLDNTGQRCVVVFMQLPDDPANALVVSTDTLPERLEAPLMAILNSSEGQSEETLGTLLARRLLPDTRQNMLQHLHENGLLHRVAIDNVTMMPMPNQPFPLRTVLERMGRLGRAQPATPPLSVVDTPAWKFNPQAHNASSQSAETRNATAHNLLIEADLLESDAKSKREMAYSYAPELRPVAVPATDASVVPAEPAAEPPLDFQALPAQTPMPAAEAVATPSGTGEPAAL